MPRIVSNTENSSTVQMMKLFQDNVRKDIFDTNDLIKTAQEKLKACDINLNSLKEIAHELNVDYANIEKQVRSLNSSFRTINYTASNSPLHSTMTRTESTESIPNLPTNSSVLSSVSVEVAQKLRDELEELENTYLFVTNSPDGTVDCVKRSSICSTISNASTASSAMFDDEITQTEECTFDSEDELTKELKKTFDDTVLNERCNKLIEMLLVNTNIVPANN